MIYNISYINRTNSNSIDGVTYENMYKNKNNNRPTKEVEKGSSLASPPMLW